MADFRDGEMGMERFKGGMVSFGRVLDRELFLFFLDLEVKRARRYQNFLSLMFLKIEPSSKEDEEGVMPACYQTLSALLTEEVRESDIIGNLEENRLAVLFPYADVKAGNQVKSRVENILKYCDLGSKGVEIMIDQICFPINGADTMDLIKRG
jgi:hypothetical protein